MKYRCIYDKFVTFYEVCLRFIRHYMLELKYESYLISIIFFDRFLICGEKSCMVCNFPKERTDD